MTIDLRRLVDVLEPPCRNALEGAVGLALANGHASVSVGHWLQKLLEADGPLATELSHKVELGRVTAEITASLAREQRASGSPALSPNLIVWIREAFLGASLQCGRALVGELDLGEALLTEPTLRAVALDTAPSLQRCDPAAFAAAALSAPGNGPDDNRAQRATPSGNELAKYTVDLTAQARSGAIDPVIGRESEIRQVVDILSRRRQNNPILVGEAGVGKTAIVEGFALRVAAGDVPPALRDINVLSLDLGLLQAGAGARGEFEARLKGVISAVKTSPVPVILFIDEAHTLIGAGGQAGQGDAANMIKPELARGELRTIAATTWAEYKKYFERDAALTRRFQAINVVEPATDIAIAMMRGLVPALEKHHGVRITEAALDASVRLSARYIPARQLPDKSVSLLDTAAASVALSRTTPPAAVEDAEQRLARLRTELASVQREGSRDRAAELEAGIALATAEATGLRTRWETACDLVRRLEAGAGSDAEETLRHELAALQGDDPMVSSDVGRDAVAAVVTRWTGIPVGRVLRDGLDGVLSLEQALRRRVIGQDHAIRAVTDAVQVSRARLTDPRKPAGVFLLVGTSGVGKTETALALAEQLYGGAQSLTTVNLSEFKEEHKVSMLVGSPPGYVGYGEGGVLTEAVRRRPYGVLLLDEVEKAHPGVQDVFYQVFDKGSLRDGEGRDIDFRNVLILLTANVGSELLAALAADPDTMPDAAAIETMLRPELLKVFKPAFLGRVTVIPYLPLSTETFARVVDLQLERVRARAAEAYGADIVFAPGLTKHLGERAAGTEVGARAIEQIIARELLPLLSRHFLLGMKKVGPNDAVLVQLDDAGRFVLSQGSSPAEGQAGPTQAAALAYAAGTP